MSNNDRIFNAGLVGATAAIEAGRLISSVTAGNYQGVRDTAVTFANRLDLVIAPDPTLTDQDELLMAAICNQVLAGRFNTSTTAADFNTIATAISALFAEVRASLNAVPSAPVTLNVLTDTVYVDRNTFAATSDGSINNPFVTVQDAVDALPAGGTILIVPGDYSADGAIVLGDFGYAFINLSPHNVYASGIAQANGTAVFLPAVSQSGVSAVLVSAGITFDTIDVSTLLANSCELDGAACTIDQMIAYDCFISTATFDLALASNLDRCTFVDNVAFNVSSNVALTMTNTSFSGVVAASVTFTGAPGTLNLDDRSAFFWSAIPGTVTNGTVVLESLGLTNLATTWYCDADTSVATDLQTGNIEAPFATIAQAIAAAASLDTIVCVGNFVENVTIDKFLRVSAIAEAAKFFITGTLDMVGAIAVFMSGGDISGSATIAAGGVLHPTRTVFGGTITGAGAFDATDCTFSEFHVGNAALTRCTVNGDAEITGGGIQAWRETSVTGSATVGDFTGTDCHFSTNLVGSGPTELTRCFVQGNISGITQLVLDDCTVIGTTASDIVTSMHDSSLTGAITTNAITLSKDCEFGAISITGANPNRMEGCKYTSLAGVAGSTIASDAYSASWAAVTGGLVRSLISPKATVSVVVPALAANAIGTATAVLTGTVLAGLTTSQQVVGSEPTAGVAGGGFLGSTRISATNTALFTFHGPTTGGAQNFVVTQI